MSDPRQNDPTPPPGQTRRVEPPRTPPSGRAHVQPRTPKPTENVQRVSGREPQPQPPRAPRSPRESGLYLPLWSLALMLLVVMGISFAVVMLVLALGNNDATATPPEGDPVVLVLSPQATFTPVTIDETQAILATPTLPPQVEALTQNTPPGALALQGPTLEAVVFTPTPPPISIGVNVIVDGVGQNELNVREVPGVQGTSVLFRAPEGTAFNVIEGPAQADGFTWWRIQSVSNPNQSGWAAANYLLVQEAAP